MRIKHTDGEMYMVYCRCKSRNYENEKSIYYHKTIDNPCKAFSTLQGAKGYIKRRMEKIQEEINTPKSDIMHNFNCDYIVVWYPYPFADESKRQEVYSQHIEY